MKYLALALFILSGCNHFDDSWVIDAVAKQGYTEVRILDTHYTFAHWRGCSQSDRLVYDIAATNALGKRVELVACTGYWFKGLTLRAQ